MNNYIQFGDILDYEIDSVNPIISERNSYVMVVKIENDGFFAIKGRKYRNISDEQKDFMRKSGLLLGEDNSDLHTNVFFDYNNIVKIQYDYINGYRWTLTNEQKNEATQRIIKAHENGTCPEDFKINSFLKSIKYKSEDTENLRAEVSMLSQINNANPVETNAGSVRTRTNIVNK